MYGLLLPAFNIAQYLFIMRYPIQGERLRILEEKQASTFQVVVNANPASSSG